MARKQQKKKLQATRRTFTNEFREDAVQMLLDGHSANSIAERLGILANLLYRWNAQSVAENGPTASALESRVAQLESELRRVSYERRKSGPIEAGGVTALGAKCSDTTKKAEGEPSALKILVPRLLPFEVALLCLKILAKGHNYRSQGQRTWNCKRAEPVWPTAIFSLVVAD